MKNTHPFQSAGSEISTPIEEFCAILGFLLSRGKSIFIENYTNFGKVSYGY